VVIARRGKPVARIVAVTDDERHSLASIYGKYAGQIHIRDDFDELPDDIAEALGAK
jgi:antitoxin (DNA-binding transcriptional repressor) of toxin-antitoxin stability system